ncbi:MAG TPA: hypothetical protein VL859_00145 [Flavobacterium sp.]|nr:hypothetical protein [Flavobacterium sp.]
MLKKTIIQYLLGIGLALLVIPIALGTFYFFPNIGWDILIVMSISIFVFQVAFYYLTTNHNFVWTVLSFIANFGLWTFEQVSIEKNFHDNFIYQNDDYKIGVMILGAILWVTNKIIIDKIYTYNKSIDKRKSKIEWK